MKKTLLAGFKFILICIVLFGGIYPLVVTGIGQLFFSHKANGSLLMKDQDIIGSSLVGQPFTSPVYFWGRPMQVSQLSPYAAEHKEEVTERTQELLEENPTQSDVPIDLVSGSASGVDPDISLESAVFQVDRIASARNINKEDVEQVIKNCTQKDLFSNREFVNVLALNYQLDML